MAISDKIHYIEVRERYVHCIWDLLSRGQFKSQVELADFIGVRQTRLNKLINAVKYNQVLNEAPTIDMIVNLGVLFGYSCEWIMTGLGSMKIKESQLQRLNRLDKEIKQIRKIIDPK